MTKSEFAHRLKSQLLQHYNNRCFFCGSTINLQFAHIRPTKINGQGRGRITRYYDIKNNLLKYELLCEECHTAYDSKTDFKFSNAVFGKYILKR
jgi:hypothetical protein